MIIKMWKHFKLVNKHRWLVFKLSIRAGIPWRGFVHDLSKYSPIEFIESSRHYDGKDSPYINSRKALGCSKAWLQHKAKNKHHEDYWYDWNNKNQWDNQKPLEYFHERKIKELFHYKTFDFLISIYTQISDDGIDKTITKKNLKEKYNKYCNE